MAGLLGKITSFVRSPSGQRALRTATGKAQELAKDPRTKDKITQVRQRFQGGGAAQARRETPNDEPPAPR